MDVFGNFYLMRDICGINYEFDNLSSAEDGLWHVLQLSIQPEQQVDSGIFDICARDGNIIFMEWLTVKKINGCS